MPRRTGKRCALPTGAQPPSAASLDPESPPSALPSTAPSPTCPSPASAASGPPESPVLAGAASRSSLASAAGDVESLPSSPESSVAASAPPFASGTTPHWASEQSGVCPDVHADEAAKAPIAAAASAGRRANRRTEARERADGMLFNSLGSPTLRHERQRHLDVDAAALGGREPARRPH